MILLDILKNYICIKKKPDSTSVRGMKAGTFSTAILIPTYCPTLTTYRLIKSIKKYDSNSLVIIIDDKTPYTKKTIQVLRRIRELAKHEDQVKYIRTKKNKHKAGALNFGFEFLSKKKLGTKIVFTMDDDVVLGPKTLDRMKHSLYSENKIGAVCSFVRVTNKNKNIVTRLQGLEYHSFNMTKIADNTFFDGPLVMQGMLTGFRTTALKGVKGFTSGHLIEDYDITVRLKKKGWKVRIEDRADAWTSVPETIEALWKQRVRWTYGGLNVVANSFNNLLIVFQDILGHSLFLSLLFLILISFVARRNDSFPSEQYILLSSLAILLFLISIVHNLILLHSYKDSDWKDWIVKLSILPELFYSNFLTLNLIGTYLFFIYKNILVSLINRVKYLKPLYAVGLNVFLRLGYSLNWGTKEISKKGGKTI